MKIVQINATCDIGSTGKICRAVSELLSDRDIENYIFYTHGNSDYPLGIKYENELEQFIYKCTSKITGKYGFGAHYATWKLIKQLDLIKPDIIHLHNIHAHNVNLELLFSYIKERKIKCFWTFHDCWAFTGYCPHFTMIKCEKWKTQCYKCELRTKYSWLFDKSEILYKKKKSLLNGLDMKIITPSQWLAIIVKKSFLSQYPVKIINNGIDLNIFYPRPNNLREKYGIGNNVKIILGVAFGWDERKGLDVFIELASRLENEKYQIILVGTNDKVDSVLPSNIVSIHRTNDQVELAELYTASDVFVNPTREENYPTVNMEAIACGTPVITFNTGGSPEILDEKTGVVVECDDIDEMERQIIRICTEKVFKKEDCIRRAQSFDKNLRFNEYAELLIGELK